MFRFADLSYFYFLTIILILIVIYIFRALLSKKRLDQEFSSRILKYYWQKVGMGSFGLKRFVFFTLASVFALIGLWRPQYGQKKVALSSEGVEVVFVLDISRSMAAKDVKPERLRLAKIQLKELIKRWGQNRMGLIAFAGQVGVISPLTQDVGALTLFLDSLDFDTISDQGTNITLALSEAKALLQRGGRQDTGAQQVVVLITDGEDHSSDSLSQVKALHSEGIRTFVIGVGSKEGGKIPLKDSYNQSIGYLRDAQNKVVVSKPNFKFLKALARAGHGGFYTLGFGGKMYEALSNDLDKMKKVGFESENFDIKAEHFQYPLFLAILFYTLSLLSTRTGRAKPIRSLKYIEDKDDV